MRTVVLFLVAFTLAFAFATPARAQCGAKRSTCSACHDGMHASMTTSADWHRQHAFADVCAVCHGGDPEANDVTKAHAALVAPLGDAQARCGSCHGAKSEELALRYRGTATATDARPVARPAPIERHGRSGPNAIAGALAFSIALGGVGFVVLRERRKR